MDVGHRGGVLGPRRMVPQHQERPGFVTRKTAWRVGESNRFDLRTTTYQWKNGAWSRPVSSTRNRQASQKAADGIFGWNIPYLKRS